MSFSKEIRGLKPENVKFELHNGTAVNELRTEDDSNYRRGRRRMLSLSVPPIIVATCTTYSRPVHHADRMLCAAVEACADNSPSDFQRKVYLLGTVIRKAGTRKMQPDDDEVLYLTIGEDVALFLTSELPMPWFGIDIGGTLVKLVYFEPRDHDDVLETEEEVLRGRTIQRYLITNKAYGESGVRDDHLQLNDVEINGRTGTIHFIRFPTDRMVDFISLVKSKGFAQMSSTVCATGGGAVKYAKLAETELNMQLHKADELESLIKGIEFVAATNPDECYYYEHPLDEENCKKVIWRWSSGRCSTSDLLSEAEKQDGLQYPYIVCNIGSGVSVLAVRGHNDFERISGSSIGGGFFQGLCAIMCGCETFEEAIELASRGDNRNVDKLVKDIYGTGYEQIGLPGDIVAASFGKVCSAKERDKIRKEDLARSALVTTTNNIGSIAFNGAKAYGIDRIVFVGNFLRVNPIAAHLLSNAMTFWSKGTKKALFLVHEGYFGAVGCLDKLVDVTEMRRRLRNAEKCGQKMKTNEASTNMTEITEADLQRT